MRAGEGDALGQAVARALGVGVRSARPLTGGDINEAFALELADGRTVFAKTNARAPRAMFPAEARGLKWLAAAKALRVPDVLAVSPEDDDDAPSFLVLEAISPARPARDFDEQLGHGLAQLHRSGAPTFGLDHGNFIGSLPQTNGAQPTWATFYRTRRLEPQVRRAAGLLSSRLRGAFDDLFDRLEILVGPQEPPARLHGDLWSGNLLIDEQGAPCLIDSAVYGGHREMDLAMMRLFGGFSARVFDAYNEVFPLDPDHAARVPLYQLYPLLVHVNLFGSGYISGVESALRTIL